MSIWEHVMIPLLSDVIIDKHAANIIFLIAIGAAHRFKVILQQVALSVQEALRQEETHFPQI